MRVNKLHCRGIWYRVPSQPYDRRGMVVSIGEKNLEMERFLSFAVRHPLSFLGLGRDGDRKHDSFASYLIQDESGSYEVMVPYEWQHMCYSYNATGYSHMVLVSWITN